MNKKTIYVISVIAAIFLFLVGVVGPLKTYKTEIEVTVLGLIIVLLPILSWIRIRRIGLSKLNHKDNSSDNGELNYQEWTKRLIVIKRRLIATIVGFEIFFITISIHMMELVDLDKPYVITSTLFAFILLFVLTVISTLTICPKCSQWFYRNKPEYQGIVGPGMVGVKKWFITVNISPCCANCGLSWYGITSK